MPQRQFVIPWIVGFLVAAPVVVLGTLFDWPAISFLGAVLLSGITFFSLFYRMERESGRHSRRSV
jgi:ABC-type transport system involved in cytochrome bd biosynthesis fused ATPase/permease subunit